MRALVLVRPERIELQQRDVPTPGPGEVLLKVEATTLCGTDLRIISGAKTAGVRAGVVLGHEIAGRIAAVGEGVENYQVGQQATPSIVLSCIVQRLHTVDPLRVDARHVRPAGPGAGREDQVVEAEPVRRCAPRGRGPPPRAGPGRRRWPRTAAGGRSRWPGAASASWRPARRRRGPRRRPSRGSRRPSTTCACRARARRSRGCRRPASPATPPTSRPRPHRPPPRARS